VLDVMDQVANNLFLLGGGLALSIFVGWRMEDPIGEAKVGAAGVTWFPMWRNLLRYVVPVVLAFVLYDAVPKTLSAVWGLFVGE